jgi:hypothetical protein
MSDNERDVGDGDIGGECEHGEFHESCEGDDEEDGASSMRNLQSAKVMTRVRQN